MNDCNCVFSIILNLISLLFMIISIQQLCKHLMRRMEFICVHKQIKRGVCCSRIAQHKHPLSTNNVVLEYAKWVYENTYILFYECFKQNKPVKHLTSITSINLYSQKFITIFAHTYILQNL